MKISPPQSGDWYAVFDPDGAEDAPPISAWLQAEPDGTIHLPDELGTPLGTSGGLLFMLGVAERAGGPPTSWRTAQTR